MLEMIFLTSNRVKFEHLKYLSSGTGIQLLEPPNYGRPYNEPRITDRDALLRQSMESANTRLFKRNATKEDSTQENFSWLPAQHNETAMEYANIFQDRFFFIEDTSVTIEALSEAKEFPGVDVKYWMKSTSFSELDKALVNKGNNRTVIVRSDIALYIPPRFRTTKEETYVVFTGTKKGRITEQETEVATNPLYPWLDSQTFNKWFIPEGSDCVLSSLPIELANAHDFRAIAYHKLLQFIIDKKLILRPDNAPPKLQQQLRLFGDQNFIIVGPSCAGKTTIAEYLSERHGYYHIEASDFMHCLYNRRNLDFEKQISIDLFASQILKVEPQVVALEIYSHIIKLGLDRYVVSGFRSKEEFCPFENEIDLGALKTIYIDASLTTRFHRNIDRGRADSASSLTDFKQRDKIQRSIGLAKIKSDRRISTFSNEYNSVMLYIKTFEQQFCPPLLPPIEFSNTTSFQGAFSLEQSILLALFPQNDEIYFTTTEISHLINENIQRLVSGRTQSTSKNNVSRYFNMGFYPFYRLKTQGGKRRYKLSVTGRNRAKALIRILQHE